MKFLSQINVNSEYTLPIVDGTNGQVLTTDGNGAVYWSSSVGATNLNALTDVELTSPSTGQILRYEIPLGGSVPVWRNVTPGYLDPNSSINALGDVTITSAVAGQILQFNGTFWINTTLSTVEYVSKVQHTVKAGVAITKGQAVYVTTSDGTNMIVGLASNAAESTSSKVIGLAASNAAINDQIFVVTEGLIAGLNTSTATAGDPVWLGTNGNLIFGLLNKPVAPAHLVYIGVVTRAQQNNGEIFVNVQNGFELNEIHDALITSPTAGQLLRRDSDNLWKNWTPNFLTAEADTLATVTARGAATTSNITVNGAAFATSFSATGLLIANADTSGSLQPDQGSPANKIYSFRWAGNEQGYIDTEAKITFAGFKTPTGTASQFLKANGTVDSNVYITSAALSGYATQSWVNSNFYNQGQIDDFFSGAEPISGYNKSNWDAAYNDKVNSASFNTTNGILTLTQQDGGTVTVDLDGRYLTSDTDAQTLTWDGGSKTLGITNGNDVILSELATEDYVLSQGFISSETDTLATVTGRGATTSVNNVQFNNGVTLRRNLASGSNVHTYVINNGGGYSSAMYIGANPGADWLIGKDPYGDGNDRFKIGSWNGYAYIDITYNTTAGTINFPNNGGLTVNGNTIWHAGNDGSGSGLDADLIDGIDSSRIVYGENSTGTIGTSETSISGALKSGFYTVYRDGAGNLPNQATSLGFYLRTAYNGVGNVAGMEFFTNDSTTSDLFYRNATGGGKGPWRTVITNANIGSQSVSYATSSGNSVSTDQTNFSELFIDNSAVATKEYVTSQGYLTSLPSHNHDDRYYTESESDARYPLSRGVIGTTSNVGDATGFGNNLASGTYTRNYTGHSGQVWMSHDTGGSVGNFAIEVTYFGSMYIHTNVDSASWSTKQIWTSENFSSTNVTNWNAAYGWGNNYISDVRLQESTLEFTGQGSAFTGNIDLSGLPFASSSHTHSASDITSGTLSTDRLPKQELGISIVGNFGQWQAHSAYQNLNTDVAYWGWNFVQGSTNAPHQSSSQWYRGRFSLGDAYGLGTSPGDYWMEIAIPRYNQGDNAGNLFVRTCENGSINAWQGVRAAFATDADTLDGNHASAFALASHTHAYLPLSGGTLSGTLSMSNNDINDINSIYINDPGAGEGINWNGGSGWGIFECPDVFDNTGGNLQFALNASERMMTLDVSGNLWVAGTYTEASSIRFKENITPLDPALDKVNQLEAVSYNKIGVDDREIGLIAEDVAELFPEVVTYNEEGQPQGIQYQRLSVILLKAVQELSQEVNELKKKLN